MATKQVAAEFDQISPVYDQTREPLDPATVHAVVERMRAAQVGSLLEIGVGTGRIARPLLAEGLEITGLDASRGMLEQARRKGLPRLVRGNGGRLPFRSAAFDGALLVHVLHLLDDPVSVLTESSRVARVGIFAIVHDRRGRRERGDAGPETARRVLREVLREEGIPAGERDGGPWSREPALLEQFPPDRSDRVSDHEVTESLRAGIDRLALRGHRNLLKVPPETLDRAIRIARERVGDRTITFHRTETLAFWSSERWRTAAPGGTGPAAAVPGPSGG